MKNEQPNIDKLRYEKEFLNLGARYVAGIDEAGRGPLAGPVVCAAVIMPTDEDSLIEGIDDSKKLSPKKRDALAEQIKERAIAYCIAEVDNETIDAINILQATRLGMKRAAEGLSVEPDMLLIDGNVKIDTKLPQITIVSGDALSYSIGAASILAKTHRDHLMCEYAKEYPQYSFEKHKGYGTKLHYQAIEEYGLCKIHRRTFIKNR